jgi:hypothetical protein
VIAYHNLRAKCQFARMLQARMLYLSDETVGCWGEAVATC